MTISEIKLLRESEDSVEFKEAQTQYNYNNGRRSVLGYVVALANEGGGKLIFGVKENKYGTHYIVGSTAWKDKEGKLKEDIYRDKKIRVQTEVIHEFEKRVLIIHIPSRPIGKTLKLDDVPLMRVGEELLPMSDEQLFKILQEQEPDFSAKICVGASINDLNSDAIKIMKFAYAEKQNNDNFITLSDSQALSDLELIQGAKITYAAIILLGKPEAINAYLPQSAVFVEYRNSINQIVFDNRQQFKEAYFTAVDKIWDLIDLRNGKVPVQQGAYIFDIPYFNKEVIREALNNAIAHRDYRRNSEVVIKQFSHDLYITNPGGFPLGVTLENLISVNSTPRNRLLADILAKTGVVERSGQGVDKIFFQSISEAKPIPDYFYSDNYQVELRLSGIVEDKAFALFIKKIQLSRSNDKKLSLYEVMFLNNVRKGYDKNDLNSDLLKKLELEGLVEKVGNTSAQKIILSKLYYSITGKQGVYSLEKPLESQQIQMLLSQHLDEFQSAGMKDFVSLFQKFLTREQVKYQIENMVKKELLAKTGKGSGTRYIKGERMKENDKIAQRVVELGIEEMRKRGEL